MPARVSGTFKFAYQHRDAPAITAKQQGFWLPCAPPHPDESDRGDPATPSGDAFMKGQET